MNTRISLAIFVSASILLASCKAQPSGPSSDANNVLDTLQVSNLHDGFPYLRGAPILTVDTFSDQLNNHYTQFNVALKFTTNTADIKMGIYDSNFPSYIPPTMGGQSNFFDSTRSISVVPSGQVSSGTYYPTIYLKTYNDVEPRTFYFYDSTRSRTKFVYQKLVGVYFGDTAAIGISDIPIPFVTIP